jgi:hypothetical protein
MGASFETLLEIECARLLLGAVHDVWEPDLDTAALSGRRRPFPVTEKWGTLADYMHQSCHGVHLLGTAPRFSQG